MIKDNKKMNPYFGMPIAFVLIFFGTFGIMELFGDKLSDGLFMLSVMPLIFVGTGILIQNASFLRLRRLARKIDESATRMNPKTFLNNNFIISKIKTGRDLYIIKFRDKYLNVLRMNEKEFCSVSWIRRVFLGPKLPTNLPIKCPVLTEFMGFKIRKCEGKAVLYDIDENQWISGQATMFSIFFFSKSMTQLLSPEIFQNLINVIDQY